MNSVFITLLRFSDYFEVHLAPTARETVESSGEDPVGTYLRINSFLAPLIAAGERGTYKDTKSGKEKRVSGVRKWKIFYLSTKNSPNRVLLVRNFIWGRFQTFAVTKVFILSS